MQTRAINLNKTFQVRECETARGCRRWEIFHTETVSKYHHRRWYGKGRTLWEAMAAMIYDAKQMGWL